MRQIAVFAWFRESHTGERPSIMYQGVRGGVCGILAVIGGVAFLGCGTPATSERRPSGEALIEKTTQELVSCAGNPLREINVRDQTVLRYYKEAPMLEESFVGSKGSKAGIHGGCWANIMLSDGRVVGVEYKPVPDTLKATEQCEEMFRACVQ